MTGMMSGQLEALTETQRAVRGHFQEGGSVAAGLLIVLGVLAMVLLVHALTQQLRKKTQVIRFDDPNRLFRGLLQKLILSVSQRRLLDTIAGDLHLEHPAAMLMSPLLFDRYVTRWRSVAGRATRDPELVGQTRAALFLTPPQKKPPLGRQNRQRSPAPGSPGARV